LTTDAIYLLTPWCRVLLEKLTGMKLVKKFPAFHGTRGFITALTIVRHLSLFWASPIQSIYPHPSSWRFILISTHLRLGLPNDFLPFGFPTKTLYTPRPLFNPLKDPVPIVQAVGWAPMPVWTGAENFVPTGFRSEDRPARSQYCTGTPSNFSVSERTW